MWSKVLITSKQRTDSGMALVLILLLAGYFTAIAAFFHWAILVLIITMAFPILLHPFAKGWFAFSNILGRFVSTILLTMVYFLLVLPVGLVRRMMGKDRLQLRQFNIKEMSAFHSRNHLFSKEDLERPF